MISFDIPFNESITKNQLNLTLRLSLKKDLKKIRSALIIGIVILSLGLLAGTDDGIYWNPFTILGIIITAPGFVSILIWLYVYLFSKRQINKKLSDYLDRKETHHYDFYEEGFKFSSPDLIAEYKWSRIKGYAVIDENIFIMILKSIQSSIIFSKSEISEEDYNSLIDLLKKHTDLVEKWD
jgi:hypothetical protein